MNNTQLMLVTVFVISVNILILYYAIKELIIKYYKGE